MKNKILLGTVLIISYVCNSQTIIVDYSFNNRIEIPKNKFYYDEENVLNLEMLNSINYTLIHSKGLSYYYSTDDDISLFNEEYRNEIIEQIGDIKVTDFTSVVFKDFKNNKMLHREYILRTAYVINSDIYDYKWEFIDKFKVISGFNCRLSKTTDRFGFEIFAWYTEEIPIPDGPLNYHKLPGLILEIHSDLFSIVFNGMRIINSDSTNIGFNEKGEEVGIQEFLDMYDEKYGKLKILKK